MTEPIFIGLHLHPDWNYGGPDNNAHREDVELIQVAEMTAAYPHKLGTGIKFRDGHNDIVVTESVAEIMARIREAKHAEPAEAALGFGG